MDLFESKEENVVVNQPLAEKMRPKKLEEFLGQEKLLGKNSLLHRLIIKDNLCSMIFWGPPGSGKTTLAIIIANMTNSDFVSLSAVTSGVKDIKSVIDTAKTNKMYNRRTILFVDEIHRFNKAQQDAFLPHVENGTIILIGATTENPSFSIISPLLSRCRVFTLNALSEDNILTIINRAISDKKLGFGEYKLEISEDVKKYIAKLSDGDARRALNLLEITVLSNMKTGKDTITVHEKDLADILQRDHLIYDKAGEEHYNIISALHKSLRSSDPQAAIYWLGRTLAAGEEPLFIARRMIRFAAEDVGLADPQALVITNSAWDTYNRLGSPEGEIALYEAAIYLATAPKSNSVYMAELSIKSEIEKTGSLPVPMIIRNAPTSLMKGLGYGKGYTYDHDSPDHFAPKNLLPDSISKKSFYTPGTFGFEKEITKRIDWWDKKRKEILEKDK